MAARNTAGAGLTRAPDPATLLDWCESVAAPIPAPAGGSASAIAAALAAALVRLVAGLTLARPPLASVHADASAAADRATVLQTRLHHLALDDKHALERFLAALAMPSGSDDARLHRGQARSAALREAGAVQRSVLELATEVAELGERMFDRGPRTAAGDAATAVFLAAASARGAYWAVRSDAEADGSEVGDAVADLNATLERAEAAERAVQRRLEA